jgi:hypothetical protein
MTWRCGHPKTPENTHGPYASHPGQCAECWRAARRRADRRYLQDDYTRYKRNVERGIRRVIDGC